MQEGEQLDVQYLIIDKKPENKLKNSKLPILVITSPSGKKTTMKFTERTEFQTPITEPNPLSALCPLRAGLRALGEITPAG